MLLSATVVAIDGMALAIEGPPGAGKSSLALALIDRGARLIGDDGAALVLKGDAIIASPPPNIKGLIELRGVGLFEMPVSPPAPLALILNLSAETQRLPETIARRQILGVDIPCLPFAPGTTAPAVRAEMAFARFGLGPS